MVITVFTAHSREGADMEEDYRLSFSPEMLGALERVPGFISYNVFFGQQGWWAGEVVAGLHWVEGKHTGRADEDVARALAMDVRNPPSLEELYGVT